MLRRLFARTKETYLWKKKLRFIIGVPVLGYGANWKWGEYNADQYLQNVLEPALVEGSVLADESEIKKVLVLLNPVANGGYATKTYERYAKPVFDCAGYQVTFKKTEYVKHERDMAIEISPEYDIIVIAGGDSTVQNFVTGLNRRPDFEKFQKIPLGIIPLGATNSIWHDFSKKVIPTYQSPYTRGSRVIESAQMIVQGQPRSVDLLALTNEDDKTIFTLTGFRWGKYYDLEERMSTYWYWPSAALKRRAAFLMAFFRGELEELRSAEILYNDLKNEAEFQAELSRQNQMKSKIQTSNFGRGLFTTGPKKVEEAPKPTQTFSIGDLAQKIEKEFFEVQVKVDQKDTSVHAINFKFESPFENSLFWNMLTPFTNDSLSNRRKEFHGQFSGECNIINGELLRSSDFSFDPQKGMELFKDDEEQKDVSYYIDGEAFVPCKLKGKLLVNHMKIFSHSK